MVVAQGLENGAAHRGLLNQRGALPVDAEALAAERALNLLSFIRLFE